MQAEKIIPSACTIKVRGVVQGVGFRPFVYRLAQANTLNGWVLNGEEGVEIYIEGSEKGVQAFVADLKTQPPPAASIAELEIEPAQPRGLNGFTIRESHRRDRPTVRISPDLPVCAECLTELFDPQNPRCQYPYINCTNCGPRYTVILALPYDRPNTTMKAWPLDDYCAAEYKDPANRRFHAQPVACPNCGPKYYLRHADQDAADPPAEEIIGKVAEVLNEGQILAIKGLGGYHLACDARNAKSVAAMRERKFRKEKPFAVMAKDLPTAAGLIDLNPEAEALLTSTARPIVLAQVLAKAKQNSAAVAFDEIAPDNDELGVMLPYTPLQHLLFASGAPEVLVMTSANRSSEPIAYEDAHALESLEGIADAFLIGERPIARRVDDSVARAGIFGSAVLRRARGYAPAAVAQLPTTRPILALGADLKNAITLVVNGQAFVSQHIGDLDHYEAFRAFEQTIADLLSMYEVNVDDLLVVHDAHPQYRSTTHAPTIHAAKIMPIQHHRAHIASVLAEHNEFDKQVLGISCDGTGYGDDGSIWGCEFFVGSVNQGFTRVAHLRPAALAGGDAAAEHPVQAAAGFLAQIEGLPDLTAAPFNFPPRYKTAAQLIEKNVRTFPTTSTGRLFDAAAALLGFTRSITFEGQAAMWLEHTARRTHDDSAKNVEPYPFPFAEMKLDFRPLLAAVARDRQGGRAIPEIARAFQKGVAQGLTDAARALCKAHSLDTIVLSGGVFQNELLLQDLKSLFAPQNSVGEKHRIWINQIWVNQAVPTNDGGISLGQSALAACTTAK